MNGSETVEMTEEVRGILQQLSDTVPENDDFDLASYRAAFRPQPADAPAVALPAVDDGVIDGPGGALPIRIYRPSLADRLPVIAYFHGGGFILGGIERHDPICRRLSAGTGAAVCSVDYRVAPEHPFPAAVDDAFAAVEWLERHAEELGFDRNKLAVGGDSAGACIAAGTALRCRDVGGPPLVLQILLVPVLRHRADTPSRRRYGKKQFGLTIPLLDWFSDLYAPGSVAAHPYCAPLLAKDLSGLPPAFIHTAELDPLRDDGVDYADRLRAAGVPAEHRVAKGLFHGFHFYADTLSLAGRAVAAENEAIRRLLSVR